MKGFLKQRKGFSLVELLIALLIMAIIAGTAITLFGGVLETSRGGADRETADAIKRAILTYMNAANDTDLSALVGTATTAKAQDVVNQLAATITISDTTVTSSPTASGLTLIKNEKDLNGTYGPFLEKSGIIPEQNGKDSWKITINKVTQVITVEAVDGTGGTLTIS